jgi:uncharacterized protein YukE
MIAAELDQMLSLRAALARHASEVSEVSRAIGAQLAATFWKGPAADRFRQAWQSDFEPALMRLQAALADAAAEVQRRHDAIQQAGS